MSQNKRPRIRDVAQFAEVSEATVSVVLNGKVGENVRVSEATQQRIWDAVEKLGYVANPVAQSLAGGQNHMIAVFTFEPVFPMDASSFYYPFLIGIEQEADIQGYDLLLTTGSADSISGKRSIYHNSINRLSRADGAILLGHGDKNQVYRLLDDQFPFVYVGRRDSPQDSISYVAADYNAATQQVVEHLFNYGHQHIAYVRTSRRNEASMDRLNGFKRAHRNNNITLSNGQFWSGETQNFTSESLLMYLDAGVTAFVAEDDSLGHRLLQIADELSFQCPQDFSLAVLGNPLNPLKEVPDWTCFSIPRREMGREAFRLLDRLLSDNTVTKPLRTTLSCTFVPGSTTGPDL